MKRSIFTAPMVLSGLLICIAFFFSGCQSETPEPLQKLYLNVDTANLNFGDYIPGTISLSDGDSLVHFENKSIGIKYRGNMSANYPKKNFSLKFSGKTCFVQSSFCRKKWKLNAEHIDKTLMRNKLSYDLFRTFSKENFAPRINYTTVYLNNEYHGIYALTERVDEDFLNFSKNDTSAVLFKHPPISNRPETHAKAYEDFVAFSNWAEFYKGFSDKAMDKLVDRCYYNQRFPKKRKSDKTYELYALTEFIFNSPDSIFSNEESFNQYFNLENIIDWHLLLLVTNNGDGLIKNFFLYRKGGNEPFKFCPWDYDHSFGRDGDGEINSDRFVEIEKVALIDRLVNLNAHNYKEKLLARYYDLKNKNILTSENIKRMIDENILVLAPYVQKNEQRWPLDSISHFEGSSFYKEIELMKNWVDISLPRIEKELIEMQE